MQPLALSISGCNEALGMENYNISDSSIQASSMDGQLGKASNGRLNKSPIDGEYGGWIAADADQNPWFQVEFGNWTKVTGISTQGRSDKGEWVTKYRVSYSYDGLLFAEYKEGPEAKVFMTCLHFKYDSITNPQYNKKCRQ